jgi:hypothetical protein
VTGVRIRRDGPPGAQFGHSLTQVRTGRGLPDVDALRDEFLHYANVLLGREPSPVESPYLTLQEVATAYHSRACEVEMLIYDGEREGDIMRGSPLYKFRTGSLASFISLAKRCADLGSRRLTQEKLLHDARLDQ